MPFFSCKQPKKSTLRQVGFNDDDIIHDEEEGLGRRAEEEVDEVLAGAGGGAGDDGGGGGAAVGVVGEGLGLGVREGWMWRRRSWR